MTQDITFIIRAKNEAKRAATQAANDLRKMSGSAKEVARDTSRAKQEAAGLADAARKAASGYLSAASAGKALAGALAGIVGALSIGQALALGVSEARKFNAALAETATLIEGTPAQLDRLTDSARDLVGTYGGSTTSQLQGFYQAISAGASEGAEATALLDQANKLAIGGVTDVTTAVDILTTAVNAYGPDTITASEASDALFVAMRAGKTTVGELAQELGGVIPFANELGVTFDELAAATAALTTQGIKTNAATTQIGAILGGIIKPSEAAKKTAADLNIAFDKQAIASKGLRQFLIDLREEIGNNDEALGKLFESKEALVGVLALTGGASQKFADILVDMRDKAGVTDEAFQKVAENLDQRLKVALADIVVSLEQIGQVILTVLVPAVEAFAAVLGFLVENVDALLIAMGLLAARALPGAIAGIIAFSGSVGGAGLALNATIIAVRTLSLVMGAIPFVAIVAGLTSLLRGFQENRKITAEYTLTLQNLEDAMVSVSDAGDTLAQQGTLAAAEAFKSAADEAVRMAEANLAAAKAALAAREEFSLYNIVTDTFNSKTRAAREAVNEAEGALIEAAGAADAAAVAVDNLGADADATGGDMAALAADIDNVKRALDRLSSGAASASIRRAGQSARLQTLKASGDIQAAAVASEVAEARARVAGTIANAPKDTKPFLQAALERDIQDIRDAATVAQEISTLEGDIRKSQRESGRKGKGGGGSKESSALADSIDSITSRFREQAETAALVGVELENYKIRQELLNAAQKDGVAISDATIAGIIAQKDAYKEAAREAETFTVGFKRGLEELRESVQTDAEFAANFVKSAVTGISDTISEFVKTGKLNFKSLLADLLGQIGQFLANKLITDFLGVAGGGGFPGVGGGIGQQGGTLSSLGGLFSGLLGRAAGGPVNASQAYVVGERGPELFVPSRNGAIVNNEDATGAISGPTINFNITTPDVAGFNRSRGQIAAEMSRVIGRANDRNN